MSVRQAAKAVHFPLWKLPFVSKRGFGLMHSRMQEVKPVQGMPEVIKQLQQAHYSLYIMSSNTVDSIELFLKTHGLEGVFLHIYGGVRVFGKAKVLRHMMKLNQLNPADTIYVGDEVRDVEGAKHAGIRMVAVTWGYNNAEVIAKHNPDAEAHSPAELLATLDRMLQ
jgi:phosphoglycolate phosphatase-like HAD superfamily hydrolase